MGNSRKTFKEVILIIQIFKYLIELFLIPIFFFFLLFFFFLFIFLRVNYDHRSINTIAIGQIDDNLLHMMISTVISKQNMKYLTSC